MLMTIDDRLTVRPIINHRTSHSLNKTADRKYCSTFIWGINSWARPRGTPAVVDINAMTSSGHVASSVTSAFDSAWPLSYRFSVVKNLLSPVVSEIFSTHACTHDVPNVTQVHTSAVEFHGSGTNPKSLLFLFLLLFSFLLLGTLFEKGPRPGRFKCNRHEIWRIVLQ